MLTAGIICEYNPFHAGHARQIAKTRHTAAPDLVVCLMSGEFMQRGEPAVCDKWTRARMALAGGADVVLELPFLSSVRSAERFARGAVRILDAIGTDILSFGAETPDVGKLEAAADILNEEPAEFRSALQNALARGTSYAGARREAAAACAPRLEELVATPNNVLAIEYLRAVQRLGSPVRPLAIERRGAAHGTVWDPGQDSPSSFGVRAALYSAPSDTVSICRAAGVPQTITPVRWHEPLFTLVAGVLRRASPASLCGLLDMESGLEWRMTSAAREAAGFSDFVERAQSRRCPAARIRRLALYALFGVTRELAALADDNLPPYVHVLGVRRDAMDKFRQLCRSSRIPLEPSPKAYAADRRVQLDLAAGDLYGLFTNPVRPAGADYTTAFAPLPAPLPAPHG